MYVCMFSLPAGLSGRLTVNTHCTTRCGQAVLSFFFGDELIRLSPSLFVVNY